MTASSVTVAAAELGAAFSVTPLPSTASVSDTRVDGKETKPLRVNLTAGGTPSGDLSPVENKAGGWYVTTHAFNGTSFKSGTWTITITNPKLVHPTATAFSGVHKISPAPRASSSACREYDGTTVKFEYR